MNRRVCENLATRLASLDHLKQKNEWIKKVGVWIWVLFVCLFGFEGWTFARLYKEKSGGHVSKGYLMVNGLQDPRARTE